MTGNPDQAFRRLRPPVLHNGDTLPADEYHAVEPDAADGLHKSVVYPGLWLDKPAMLRGDMAAVLAAALAALQLGLASPGHADFAAKLRESARI